MHNERSNDTDLSAMVSLVELRNRIGYVYGSEDTCTLFYAMVRRERPVNIVELGAGLGVTALWMAQAVKENGAGRVWTLDDASHWQDPRQLREALKPLAGVERFATLAQDASSYQAFMDQVIALLDLGDHTTFMKRHIDVAKEADFTVANYPFLDRPIDFLFLDINRTPEDILDSLYLFLPHLAEAASIFIDSASTSVSSYLFLEKLIEQLNRSKVPRRFLLGKSPERQRALIDLVAQRKFSIMHLIEKVKRAQNSMAWIRVEPNDYMPHPQALMKWV
jgi:hypothetical protein